MTTPNPPDIDRLEKDLREFASMDCCPEIHHGKVLQAADLIARLPEVQGQRDEALRLLRKCRNEMAGLPHSLGYAFTHLPELDKTLAASDESMSAIGDAGEKP